MRRYSSVVTDRPSVADAVLHSGSGCGPFLREWAAPRAGAPLFGECARPFAGPASEASASDSSSSVPRARSRWISVDIAKTPVDKGLFACHRFIPDIRFEQAFDQRGRE